MGANMKLSVRHLVNMWTILSKLSFFFFFFMHALVGQELLPLP